MKTSCIPQIGNLKTATISILAEDSITFDTPFWGRFGLSMLLELCSENTEKKVLFDTNSSAKIILHNLEILGKSLDEVSTIFLSHCHYDHTDGLAGILDAMEHPVSVIAHPQIFRPCFEKNNDGIRHIGIVGQTRSGLEQKGAVFSLTDEPLPLMQGVLTMGEIERSTSFEGLEDLYTIIDGNVVQDHELDDMSLIFRLPEGLVIVTGCCHAGIVNTMEHAKRICGVDRIYAVVGGLHLIDANKEKVEKSIEALREVDWVFAGHCTGFEGMRRMAEVFGERFAIFHTGEVIHLPVADPEKRIYSIPANLKDLHRFS